MSHSDFPVSVKHTKYREASFRPPVVATERSGCALFFHLVAKRLDMIFLILVATLALVAMYRHEFVLKALNADLSNVQGFIAASLIV